jgi:prefoldin subunit 5
LKPTNLGATARRLRRLGPALAGELRALERPMKELRAQMEAIQRQLDALHQKQELASSKEETDVRALFRRAIAAGTAKPVR